jgi:hypothetical protein
MSTKTNPVSHPPRLFWLLVASGLVLRFAFALLPLSQHLILLEDDAWMVAAIARNFARGLGVTADGINPTTGFQPLYPLTLGTLPFLFAPNNLELGFSANLVICALLGTLACWPLWRIANQLGGSTAGLIAVGLYALNPTMVRLTVNAMETSLGLLLLLIVFATVLTRDMRQLRNGLWLGLLTALAVLARLDASLAFAAITLTLLWGTVRRTAAIPASWSTALSYPILTMVLLSPYFAFNYSITGDFGPSSGRALQFMQSFAGSFNLTNGLSSIFQNSAIALDWIPSLALKAVLVITALAGLLWLLRGELWRALPLVVFVAIPPLYYGYLLQQQRERYFVGMSVILLILLGWSLAVVLQRWKKPLARGGVLAMCVVVVGLNTNEALGFYRMMLNSPLLTQPISYQAARWLGANLPEDALIGAKNSGIYQYYSGRTVLNIDGKLNHEIVPVMEQRQLLDYLRQRGVTHLVDRESVMARHISFYSHQFGPAPAHRAPSLRERIDVYVKLLLNRLGANQPLNLNRQEDFRPTRPFNDAVEIVQQFPRPNQSGDAVTIYRLKPAGAGVP